MISIFVPFALCNLLYMTLHVTASGSFPKPLTPKQEQECLMKIRQGDEEARNTLIIHNLRLVAHIIKNGASKRRIFSGPALRRTPLQI